MKPILKGPGDACFMPNFSFPAQWNWLDNHQRRFRLNSGEGQVKIRLRSGQKRSNFQVDIFAYKRYLFDAAHHGESNGGLIVLLYVINNGKK